ncbi:tagaturonate reductase [Gracilibacillus alcaliphilus]|uniref:tagaturonate reductase n=1 Tax=Gracilibacillus alcaliphilus TaxID=1401441 RepID=UPI00195AA338|nr:tagaturonate reductase [Gracilibacillus alcaliphilus]MBM7676450.1 tagaturonate reductase [Gracilibacillus alcaliphilus]
MTHVSLKRDRENPSYPVKVLQIGDGNFIRSFIDWMIDQLNERTDFNGSVITLQALPQDQTTKKLNHQDGLFTLLLKGKRDGQPVEETRVISAIKQGIDPYTNWTETLKLAEQEQLEFVFSNTTEAGIRYVSEQDTPDICPVSYPGKLTRLLYHRYLHFNGDLHKGWTILPCELIENNGDELKKICLQVADDWQLPQAFITWIEKACTFCNTLVDRIVPGFPSLQADQLFEQLGYQDPLLAVAEPYHLFVVESDQDIKGKLPFQQAGLHVVFDQIYPYRELKVKFLNGSHTMLATLGTLCGIAIVRDAMKNTHLFDFIHQTLVEEIAPTLTNSSMKEINVYIQQMYDRFDNPYLDHKLSDIQLNSYAKFKTRVWPSLLTYKEQYGTYPVRLVFSFAALLYFFKEASVTKQYAWKDDPKLIKQFESFFTSFDGSKATLTAFIRSLLQQDFSANETIVEELAEAIAADFIQIEALGAEQAIISRK